MRKIEVLGSGCNNCVRLGIMSTPGLVIDGMVVSYGRIPTAGDIAEWLIAPVG